MATDWFADWFDSKYYHKLYKNRNDEEAEYFIKNLVEYFNPLQTDYFLDLACGKGRHAIFLNKLGLKVDGCDLSKNSIKHAKKNETDTLHFFVHDMREKLPKQKYSHVLNLFTSFGYFDSLESNLKVLESVNQSLKKNGYLVIDFLNAEKVRNNLVAFEQKTIDGTLFVIKRYIENNIVHKQISFLDDKKSEKSYTEKVQLITLNDFSTLLKNSNFELLDTFGEYDLSSYKPKESNRLILIAQKK